jgi:hypothetical protein
MTETSFIHTVHDCLQMASVPSQRTNKLCTHAHHHDGSAAMAIFANGTYFVDMPHSYPDTSIQATRILIQPAKISMKIYRF